jgi:hypothetical protein
MNARRPTNLEVSWYRQAGNGKGKTDFSPNLSQKQERLAGGVQQTLVNQ